MNKKLNLIVIKYSRQHTSLLLNYNMPTRNTPAPTSPTPFRYATVNMITRNYTVSSSPGAYKNSR
jgi:hypothetical protein